MLRLVERMTLLGQCLAGILLSISDNIGSGILVIGLIHFDIFPPERYGTGQWQEKNKIAQLY